MHRSSDRLPFTLKSHVQHSAAVRKAAELVGSDLGDNVAAESLGGLLRNGQLAYLAVGCLLEVVAVKSGARLASCNFDQQFGTTTHITCVTELGGNASGASRLPLRSRTSCTLAIGLDSAGHGGLICLFAVHGAQLLRTIELPDKVTACSFLGDAAQCARLGSLHQFDGALAVGTASGQVFLLDLQLQKSASSSSTGHAQSSPSAGNQQPTSPSGQWPRRPVVDDCLIVLASIAAPELQRERRTAHAEGISFAVQLPALQDAGAVLCALGLAPLQALAIGLSDGRLVLYSLAGGDRFEAFHLAHPSAADAPLLRLALVEPANDPRACVYLWAFHVHTEQSMAVMHSIMYERKRRVPVPVAEATGNGGAQLCPWVYETFQSCTVRLQMPLFERESYPIALQAVQKAAGKSPSSAAAAAAELDDEDEDDADTQSLCVLAWTTGRSNAVGSMVCVFDLNQWYKEQMPRSCDWRRAGNSFLAVYPLGELRVLDVLLDAATLAPFASQQRPEEHFWPAALSFDCIALTAIESCRVRWPGLQNQALEMLVQSGPPALLEPNQCFGAMVQATLIPQFVDYHVNVAQTPRSKQHFLLSIALEYNCTALLRDCALAWADGSHLGASADCDADADAGGLSLSTLCDWAWQRAGDTKRSCNQLCVPLFDHSCGRLDARSRQQLLNYTRQLRHLADLLETVLQRCARYIPGGVRERLQSQLDAIRMAHEYQEVLQWLLNMGLLPEGRPSTGDEAAADSGPAVPYPYRELRDYYARKRATFRQLDAGLLNAKRSCRALYIDAFIEHECNPACLRAEWRQTGAVSAQAAEPPATGLYPPPSLQAMLRTLLVPGVAADRKHTLFVYLFLDLSVALGDTRHAAIVQRLIKFPAVFRLNPAAIKTTQAFWQLDHGQLGAAIEDLHSPLAQERQLQPWQQECLVESLLAQGAEQLALRALRAPGPPISALLEVRTLLANNLVSEAFQLQRTKRDARLLPELFRSCHAQHKWQYVLDLSLSAAEEEGLGRFLRTCQSTETENLHFVYLLQRGKYVEAIAFVDDLQHNRRTTADPMCGRAAAADLETPTTILAAYTLTMTPTSRRMATMWHSLRDNINTKLNATSAAATGRREPANGGEQPHPNPLSTKLLQHKLDLLGGVYHRSVVSAEQTNPGYWHQRPQRMCSLNAASVPFLRNPQYDVAALAERRWLEAAEAAEGGAAGAATLSYPVEYVGSQKRSAQTQAENWREADGQGGGGGRGDDGDDGADYRGQGPQKRRRLDPSANDTAEVLAVFRAKTKAALNRTPKQTKALAAEAPALLSTPVVVAATSSNGLRGVNTATPQSILKASLATGIAETAQLQQQQLDEKSIRFADSPAATIVDAEHEDIDCGSTVTDIADAEMSAAEEEPEEEQEYRAEAPSTNSASLNYTNEKFIPTGRRSIGQQRDSSAEDFHTPDDTAVQQLSIDVSAGQVEQAQQPAYAEELDAENTDNSSDTNSSANSADLVSPPAQHTKQLFSQQPSPLQRRINLGEGPRARKRLHSSVSRDTPPDSADPDAPVVLLTERNLAATAARKSKARQSVDTADSASPQKEQLANPSPLARRSLRSRSRTPEVSSAAAADPTPSQAAPAATTSTKPLVSTPMGRKTLSRLVLEANAKKAIVELQMQQQPQEAVVIVESSNESNSNSSSDPSSQSSAANAADEVENSMQDLIADVSASSSDAGETSGSTTLNSGGYMTDDSQRFLDYWAARNPARPSGLLAQLSATGSLNETAASEMAGAIGNSMSDSDASFVCDLSRQAHSEVDDDDVDDVDDDDDQDEYDFADADANSDEEQEDQEQLDVDDDEDDDDDVDEESGDDDVSSSSSDAQSNRDEVINISSSSEESEAPQQSASPQQSAPTSKDTTDEEEDETTNSLATNRSEVFADVHTEPTSPGAENPPAVDDNGEEEQLELSQHSERFQMATSTHETDADLEEIRPADETHLQPSEETVGDDQLNRANLQISVDSSTKIGNDHSLSQMLSSGSNVDSSTATTTTLNHAIICESDLMEDDAESTLASANPMETHSATALNEAIIGDTNATTSAAMEGVEETYVQAAEDSHAELDQAAYLPEDDTTTPAAADTTEIPLADREMDDDLATAAALEAAVEAMDEESIAAAPFATHHSPVAETDALETQQAAAIASTTVVEPIATASSAIEATIATPSRRSKRSSTSRAPSISLDDPDKDNDDEVASATAAAASATAMLNTPTSRRSVRLRSNSQLDTLTPATPRTPASTRKQRGQSEPKSLVAANVRRLLEESKLVLPAVEEDAAPVTPSRRGGRRSKQATPAPDEAAPATPTALTPSRALRSRRGSSIAATTTTTPPSLAEPGIPRRAAAIGSTPKRSQREGPRAGSSLAATSPESIASQPDDDNVSVVSVASRQSTRSTRSTRLTKKAVAAADAAAEHVDDVFDDDNVSVKSSRSTRSNVSAGGTKRSSRAAAKVLPAIDEAKEVAEEEERQRLAEEKEAAADADVGDGSVEASAASYSSSRRLTRHQINVMERMKTASSAPVIRTVASNRSRRGTSASKPDEEQASDNNEDDDNVVDGDDDDNDEDDRQSVQSAATNRSAKSARSTRRGALRSVDLEPVGETGEPEESPADAEKPRRQRGRPAKKQ